MNSWLFDFNNLSDLILKLNPIEGGPAYTYTIKIRASPYRYLHLDVGSKSASQRVHVDSLMGKGCYTEY